MTTWDQVLAVHSKHPEWCSTEIARELGCHPAYVRATMQRRGMTLKTSRKAGRRLQDWERQAILDAYIDGEKLEAVACEFGVTMWAVNKIGRRAGEPPRPIGRPPKAART
jgi:DNA-directed RNA polymerase specialized sigma24 family protein